MSFEWSVARELFTRPQRVTLPMVALFMLWPVSFACFLLYPTMSVRPRHVAGDGFFEWMLRTIYASDHRYNCLPSLHVAQCYLAAFTCGRVHRGVGIPARSARSA